MKVRAITALFFVIIMLAAIVLNAFFFALFFMALSISCLHEFYRIISDNVGKPNRFLGFVLALLVFGLYAGYCLQYITVGYLWLCVPFTAMLFVAPLYQRQDKPFTGVAYTLLGIVYVILPFLSFFSLGFMDGHYDYQLPLGFMLILWGNDTGAYLTGRFLGRNLLFERISPKKTWEGLAGGIVLALIAALVVSRWFPQVSLWQWVGVSLVVSAFGTFGDLVESMLKRSQQVKDSGGILPGHGGLLDRFDGLLLAAPAVLAFLYIVR